MPPSTSTFRRCVAHFVRGALNSSYFHSDQRVDAAPPLPAHVMTVDGCGAPFYSIGLQLPVDVKEGVVASGLIRKALRGEVATWKVFAPERLTTEELNAIFRDRVGEAEVIDWFAYPSYSTPQKLSSFVLDAGRPQQEGGGGSLLYLNAIEQAASAMEMSMVSAWNAANLVMRFVDGRRRENGGKDF